MRRFVISVPLKPGSSDQIRRLLREGPPFDLSGASLERHEVFLSDEELILLFEGAHSERIATELLERRRVLGQVSRIAPYVAGSARVFSAVFTGKPSQSFTASASARFPDPGTRMAVGSTEAWTDPTRSVTTSW